MSLKKIQLQTRNRHDGILDQPCSEYTNKLTTSIVELAVEMSVSAFVQNENERDHWRLFVYNTHFKESFLIIITQ